MNRELVEGATHPEALSRIVSQLQGNWTQHEAYILGIRGAERSHANLLLLARHQPFGEQLFPADLNERIKTRLGEGDRRLVLDEEIESPFGARIKALTLPAHYAPDADEASIVEHLAVEGGTIRFDFAGRAFTYDRLGLRLTDTEGKEEDKRA
jgi:CRISPR-associated endonuclease/helicase Cas3